MTSPSKSRPSIVVENSQRILPPFLDQCFIMFFVINTPILIKILV